MKEDLRILMVEPQKAPYEASIPHELTAMQQTVGGLIEVVRNGDGTLLVCNEEGKLLGMEGNRRIPGDVLAGPFFVVGDAGETFRSLTEEELERYRERFAEIEDISPQEVQAATGFFFCAIPTHQFLFNAGQINPKEYMDALQVEPSEFELIKYPERGTCLYRCGNERYLLQVIAPEYKAVLFGSAGGR